VILLNGYQLICSATPVPSSDTFGRLEALLNATGREVRFFDNCLQSRVSIERLGQAFGAYLAELRYEDGAAVDEVDVIGHSMGGLIARCYLSGRQEDGTFRPPFPKRIRKLITIGTPHFGADFSIGAPDLQAAAMVPGSRFLWELATWNQFQEDLRGVHAMAIAGRSRDRAGDGLVSALSASSYFVRILAADRTRVISGCHTSGIGGVLLGCNVGETAIASITGESHPAWPLIRGFLDGDEDSIRLLALPDRDSELSLQASLWIGYNDEANNALPSGRFTASLRDTADSSPEPMQGLPNSPARFMARTRQRQTTLQFATEGKDPVATPLTLGRGVTTLALKAGRTISSVEPHSAEDGLYVGALLLPSGGRLRMTGHGLNEVQRVELDGEPVEVIRTEPAASGAPGAAETGVEEKIVVLVPERAPGAATLSVSGDDGSSHSIRVVFGAVPARLAFEGRKRAFWNEVPGAAGYVLWLGSEAGKSDLFETPFSALLSADLPELSASKVYARLWTLYDGIWSYRDAVLELP
jgi:pimeloyl-ACP methyl ester carboxylesterase